jgi:hypothetical protein
MRSCPKPPHDARFGKLNRLLVLTRGFECFAPDGFAGVL